MQLACEKSKIEHRSSNISHPGENAAHAQPSVSFQEDEIQNSNFEYGSSKSPSEAPEEDDRKPAAKRIKKEPEDEAQSWAQEEQIEKPTPKPWEDKKDYEAIFRKFTSIGDDGEEHYDVIDIEIEAKRAVSRITDHQEIVKQYQTVVRAYNNFMQEHLWKSTGGLIQDKSQFVDMLKDEKRKHQFKFELGKLMDEYEVPLPLGKFNLNIKETRRLDLWNNQRRICFDHIEHIEEGQEKNKEWENFWWTVYDDMFYLCDESRIEELVEEKLNQEFPEEVETRESQNFESD